MNRLRPTARRRAERRADVRRTAALAHAEDLKRAERAREHAALAAAKRQMHEQRHAPDGLPFIWRTADRTRIQRLRLTEEDIAQLQVRYRIDTITVSVPYPAIIERGARTILTEAAATLGRRPTSHHTKPSRAVLA